MASEEISPPGDILAVLAELGRKLATGDLTDLAVLAAKMRSGKEIVWTQSTADVLRLLTALAENLVQDTDQDGLNTALASLADDELDEVAAALMQLEQQVAKEAAKRRQEQ